MSKNISLKILGEPIGKGRPKITKTKNFARLYSPTKTVNYESRIITEYKRNYSGMVFEANEPIKAVIQACFIVPCSNYVFHKKTNSVDLTRKGQSMINGLIRPTKKPDCDNIAKICLDALNGIAYFDDSQVVELVVNKTYSRNPFVSIVLTSLRRNDEIGD